MVSSSTRTNVPMPLQKDRFLHLSQAVRRAPIADPEKLEILELMNMAWLSRREFYICPHGRLVDSWCSVCDDTGVVVH